MEKFPQAENVRNMELHRQIVVSAKEQNTEVVNLPPRENRLCEFIQTDKQRQPCLISLLILLDTKIMHKR
jgi:hypothetical protein